MKSKSSKSSKSKQKTKVKIMYDFDIIYSKLIQDEGGYANDPKDSGGETYKGITRKNYPNLRLWTMIDAHKNQYNFMPWLETDPSLETEVKEFYYRMYKKSNIDKLHDFKLKEKFFSSIVNLGKVKASVILQQSYNMLIKSKVLDEDGIIGSDSIQKINDLKGRGKEDLLMFFKAELYVFYRTLTINRPKDKRFLKGWTRRAFS